MRKVHCISDGIRKAWMVLPLRVCGGRECVVVSTTSGWLMQVLSGTRYCKAYAGAICNLMELFVKKYGEVITEEA